MKNLAKKRQEAKKKDEDRKDQMDLEEYKVMKKKEKSRAGLKLTDIFTNELMTIRTKDT